MSVKKVLASIVAALSTPEAVKIEKSIAIVALTRLAIILPGIAFYVDKIVGWLS